MTKQVQHTRTSSKGKQFFAGKRIPERYFIARDIGKPQAPWKIKKATDKDLGYFQLVEFRNYASSPFGDPDHDGILNIFDKKPLSSQDRHQVPPTVSLGNRKLTQTIGIFNLPRLYTCPGATELCRKFCYAEGPELYYGGGAVYSRNKNYAWSKRPDFVKVISDMIKNFGVLWFRIHSSGDFYNQEYYNKWAQIAKNNPQVQFLAYTKNWHLNLAGKPRNLVIRYSSDISSKHIRGELPACYTGVSQPKNFFLCKKKCEPGFCMACWDPLTDVYIPVHSISNQDKDQMFFKQFNPSVPDVLQKRLKKRANPDPKDPLIKLYGIA